MNNKYLSYFTILFLFMFSGSSFSANQQPAYNTIFAGTDGCFILYDLTLNKLLVEYNPKHCQQRFSPGSTFKIPIAIMAFDRKILKDENTIIKWDGVNREFTMWNQDQTPKTWLEYSTVWVSQKLMPQIGAIWTKKYLSDFNYGNQDMSGGITKAWLSASLTISADEQLAFLIRFWLDKLNVSHHAIKLTIKSMYAEKSEEGNLLLGKTGAAFLDGINNPNSRRIGWYVGFLGHGGHIYVFVTNFNDITTPDMTAFAGEDAELMTKQILHAMNLY